MKAMTILGILALMMLLVIPGAVSAADVTVSGSIVKPDLVVNAISPNVGAGAFLFANEPNVISVTVKNIGTAEAGASTLSIDVGGTVYTEAIGTLAVDATQTVTVTDPTSYAHGASVTVAATADSAGVIDEGDETNNVLSVALTVYDNGYKGKRWTPTLGGDMETQATFTGRYDLVYSTGNSVYKSRNTWDGLAVTWTASDLPIPAGATVESARLYQGTSSNDNYATYPNPNPGMSFNGVTKTPVASYMDTKNYGTYDYPYGLLVYDVTTEFNTAGNTLVMTQEAPSYAIYGAYLVVVYEDPATTEKKIWINDEFDLIYSGAGRSVSNEEATTYAPFTGVDTGSVATAKVIAIAPSCDETKTPISSTFFFNSQTYTTPLSAGWLATPQIAFTEYDVATALMSGDNEARMQSTISGTNGDFMAVSNAILIVEYEEGAVNAAFSADPLSGDKPLEVTFTDESTGYIIGYEWNFGDGTTSTLKSPTHIYTARGTYTVSLTVTGVGTSDTETKTGYITVKEPAPVIDFGADVTSGPGPLTVTFTATNSGGQVDSWVWDFGDGQTGSGQVVTHTYTSLTAATYTVSLTATGPDYTDVETKANYITVGAAVFSVTVDPAAIAFGTMTVGDQTGSTAVTVTTTGGTAWSVDASATNGGFMGTGSMNLANPFQLANGPGSFQAMTSDFDGFMTGSQYESRTDSANVKQAIAAADAPGAYSITLTFTGGFA